MKLVVTGPQEAFLWWWRGGGAEQKCRSPWLANDEKRPKAVPKKKKFGPKYKLFKNLIFGFFFFFENIISDIKSFYNSPKVPQDIIRVSFFLILDFPLESLKANKNQRKRSHILQYSFAQKISLILQTSTHLTLKIICSRNAAKKFSDFTNFQQTCFCLVSEKYLFSTIS